MAEEVLILVLMEYALWLVRNFDRDFNPDKVLILVLMEYALWLITILFVIKSD